MNENEAEFLFDFVKGDKTNFNTFPNEIRKNVKIRFYYENEKEIFKALKRAQRSKKPIAISCKTTIGYGSPNKSGKASSHGSPLGEDEIKLVRKKLKWKYEPFKIPKEILNEWRKIGEKGISEEKKWNLIYNKKDKKINLKGITQSI
mgnify:CR=1 FL=1